MNRLELIQYDKAVTDKLLQLAEEIETTKTERNETLDRYAREHAEAAGYVKGKPYTFLAHRWDRTARKLTEPMPTTFFYDHATTIPQSGEVILHFAEAKKDGTPSKRANHVEYLVVED